MTPSLYWPGITPGPSGHVGIEDKRFGSKTDPVEIAEEEP